MIVLTMITIGRLLYILIIVLAIQNLMYKWENNFAGLIIFKIAEKPSISVKNGSVPTFLISKTKQHLATLSSFVCWK